MNGKIKLIYFDLRAKAELIRSILIAEEIEFDEEIIEFGDNTFKGEQWCALKPTTPIGQLPIMKLSCGTVLNESLAIARYCAKQANLIGSTDMENYRCDRALYTLDDLLMKFIMVFREKDLDRKATMKNDLMTSTLPIFLQALTNYLKETEGDFFLENKITLADLYLLVVLDNVEESDYEAYPSIVNCCKAVLQHYPKLKEYRDKRLPAPI